MLLCTLLVDERRDEARLELRLPNPLVPLPGRSLDVERGGLFRTDTFTFLNAKMII